MNPTQDPNKQDTACIGFEKELLVKYQQVLKKMPVFLRPMAEKAITQRAQSNAIDNNRTKINEKNLVDAFFSETPFGFQGPMMTDLDDVGLDYKKYGHPIDYTNGMFKLK